MTIRRPPSQVKVALESAKSGVTRWIKIGIVVLVRAVKPYRFLHIFLPSKLRNLARYWSDDMLSLYVRSRGTRVYLDQPTNLTRPTSVRSAAISADPALTFSEKQLSAFFDNGFIGPLQLCPPLEMKDIIVNLTDEVQRPSAIYNFPTDRDRHLDCPSVFDLCTRPSLVERVAQLLGPDLLLWRSQLWHKPPFSGGTDWHQATTFTMGNRSWRPSIWPPNPDEPFNLTAWIALDDVDLENGCLQFYRGSHYEPVAQIDLSKSSLRGGSHQTIKLALEIDPDRVVDMPLKMGEMVIFHERTIHGARPNASPRRRLGLNCRICRPEAVIYPNATSVDALVFGQTWSLERWRGVLVRGQDKLRVNRTIRVEELRQTINPITCTHPPAAIPGSPAASVTVSP